MSELAASATSPVSDGELLAEVRAGDVSSLESLYDRYAGYVHALALRIVDSSEEAEEITQDVFWQVWKKKLLYDPERGRFSTWLFAVTRNRALDRIRSVRRRPEVEALPVETAAPAGDSPEDSAYFAERRQHVRRALERLPPAQQQAVKLCFFQGMTHREVAACLDEPLGTVKSRIKMGMGKLKQSLASSGELR